ncbi:MAG: aminoacyl-tRNA hydrolase [bacterium]|nr:aminoacyl-tRNA hydrolase [bacterium]
MKLIVGLGNPGPRYALTRHNVGSLVVDELLMRYPAQPLGVRCNSTTYAGKIAGELVVLAKPLTFMNNSGTSVGHLLSAYRLSPASLLVIHDDIDLAPGRIKEKYLGGSAGHKGVASIINAIGDDCFCRIRVGVGRPPDDTTATDYVLAPIRDETLSELEATIAASADHVATVLEQRTTW